MAGTTSEQMHQEHEKWKSEDDMWRDDVRIWEEEMQIAQHEAARLQALLAEHLQALRQHASVVQSHESHCDAHEHVIAESERNSRMDALEGTHASHSKESVTHAELRVIHERLKRRHHTRLAHWNLLIKAFEAPL